MDQLARQDVAVPTQGCAPHAYRFTGMSEGPFQQFAASVPLHLPARPMMRRQLSWTECRAAAYPRECNRPRSGSEMSVRTVRATKSASTSML